MSVKLTAAQASALGLAESKEGRLIHGFVSTPTKKVLESHGLIEILPRHVESQRAEMAIRRDEFIAKAKGCLNSGDWRNAYAALGMAYSEDQSMNAKCYWITEKGRQVLAAGGVMA